MNYTENYQLPQWEESDRVLMADFNAMTAKLEAGLTGKADAADLAALEAAQASQLRVATGSYTGKGKSGSEHPNSITFPFPPQIVFIAKNSDQQNIAGTVFFRGQSKSSGMGVADSGDQLGFKLTWSGNTLSWYTTMSSATDPVSRQFNTSGVTYCYLAIG